MNVCCMMSWWLNVWVNINTRLVIEVIGYQRASVLDVCPVYAYYYCACSLLVVCVVTQNAKYYFENGEILSCITSLFIILISNTEKLFILINIASALLVCRFVPIGIAMQWHMITFQLRNIINSLIEYMTATSTPACISVWRHAPMFILLCFWWSPHQTSFSRRMQNDSRSKTKGSVTALGCQRRCSSLGC